jgi:DNA uptake protein ComE-like DNA-binding protein
MMILNYNFSFSKLRGRLITILPYVVIAMLLTAWIYTLYLMQSRINWRQSLTTLFPTHETNLTEVQVYISGAVSKPGVYVVNSSTRVWEIVQLAGGLTANADREYVAQKLHLASLVNDAQTIFIPGTRTVVPIANASAETLPKLNSATQSQLEDLPGIGAVTAAKIMSAMPVESWQQLKVAGVSEKVILTLQEHFSL